MKQIIFLLVCTFLSIHQIKAQEELIKLITTTGNIHGSIIVPVAKDKIPIVLIIAGSGPTDRDGNNPNMTNNSLKMLAEELAKSGIASLRYDKRGIAASSDAAGDVSAMRFENMSDDARGWIDVLSKDKRFSKIIVTGHSEGSLLGMVALNGTKNGAAFISIAGAGRVADELIKEQLGNVPQEVKNIVYPMLDKIKKGDSISNVPPMLYSLFHPSIQGYMSSWFKYDPQVEIKKLKIPILILQGTTDVQVKEVDAELLHKANPKAKLKIIKNMNHVLKDCENMDKKIQVETVYKEPLLPLNKEFVNEITEFILGLNK
jgi:uncharacterized protein